MHGVGKRWMAAALTAFGVPHVVIVVVVVVVFVVVVVVVARSAQSCRLAAVHPGRRADRAESRLSHRGVPQPGGGRRRSAPRIQDGRTVRSPHTHTHTSVSAHSLSRQVVDATGARQRSRQRSTRGGRAHSGLQRRRATRRQRRAGDRHRADCPLARLLGQRNRHVSNFVVLFWLLSRSRSLSCESDRHLARVVLLERGEAPRFKCQRRQGCRPRASQMPLGALTSRRADVGHQLDSVVENAPRLCARRRPAVNASSIDRLRSSSHRQTRSSNRLSAATKRR